MSDGFGGWSTFRSGNLSPVEQIRLAARVEAEAAKRAAEEAAAAAAADDQWIDFGDEQEEAGHAVE